MVQESIQQGLAQVVDVREARGWELSAGDRLSVAVVAYVEEAERMLGRSRSALRTADASVFAYRAALRAAGAVIEFKMLSRKRRPRGSAWDRLDVVAPALGEWSKLFRVHARFANRVDMGLESEVSQGNVDRIYADAARFLDQVRGEIGYMVGCGVHTVAV